MSAVAASEGRANCRIPIFRSEAAPIIIFTDAEGKKRKGNQAPSGHIRFKVIHTRHGVRSGRTHQSQPAS